MASFNKNIPKLDVYSFSNTYSEEAIECAQRWQDQEQERRIADTEGEKLKQANANRVSEMFSLNVRPTWFQRGSATALRVINVARNAGNDILRSSQVKAINAKLQVAGQKGAATAQEVKTKIAVVGAKAQEASIETAHDAKDKLSVAQGVVSEKLSVAQGVVAEKLSNAQEAAGKGIEKIQQAAQKFKRMSLKLVGRVNKALSEVSSNTNIAFAVLEEENERAYRMGNSEWECYAMMNAFAVSRLIKELAPAFYRPDFEPNALYAVKLLESSERSRRLLSDLSDRTPINNAKAVAQLIEQKQRTTTLSTPALVAAKAEIVEEIKVHKPIAATM